ncbi:uncharacterized protein BT62DRAFT_1004692 [Guyanagaster necrorhizus]|uniref:Uncharacterized protein n=1 Tax=Guyanagaster necrorhizus TaxID=856835 RepID=A0A9P7VV39_9AGAR|nr:uncharacterized protein BT62DRAFT_1004692 [Guyanagaster necrorhizus MCA 3950]KAG7447117.1 hypothetical protein BT62DRAFT_1004692 [Guyanagaster necrorhizus MCA 3950]
MSTISSFIAVIAVIAVAILFVKSDIFIQDRATVYHPSFRSLRNVLNATLNLAYHFP